MEGNFSTIPLSDALEMIHSNRSTGLLQLVVPSGSGRLPLDLYFESGEVVAGAIFDWEGLEAISSFPLHSPKGRFRFTPKSVSGTAMLPFKNFVGEWARLNDQWSRFRTLIDSPSRVLDTPSAKEPYGVFMGGKSIRGAAKAWGVPLIIAADRVWRGLQDGEISKMRKYAWYGLRIRHPSARRTHAGIHDPKDLTVVLDGSHNLGELIQKGVELPMMRAYLAQELYKGEVDVPGRGWILRDLLWEMEGEIGETPND